MNWLTVLAIMITIGGGALVAYAHTLPVYTNPNAPDMLATELRHLEMEKRVRKWFDQLASFETSHKLIADLGRGLVAGGIGLTVAVGLIQSYNRIPSMRTIRVLLYIWVAIWAARIPLSIWYWGVRQYRMDYPDWADTIAIPIFSEIISWVIGAVISTFILLRLLKNYSLPQRFIICRPQSVRGWIRFSFISLWLVYNALSAYIGVRYGNEGEAFSCLVANSILLIMLAAIETQKPDDTSRLDTETVTVSDH